MTNNNNNKGKLKESLLALFTSVVSVLITQLIAYMTSLETKNQWFMHCIALFIMIIQWIVFIHASGVFGNEPTEKYFDLTGSITYLLALALTILRLAKPSERQKVLTILGCIWSARLGWFLFSRIARNNGHDIRFIKLKSNIFTFLQVWTIQGVWVFLTLLSILYVNQAQDLYSLTFGNYFGILLWLLGFGIESIADLQKRWFRENPVNKNMWISTGLWSISRHPNYFGEILLWLGISFISIQNFKWPKTILISLISPLFVAFLLIFVSGIQMLEKHADERFGNQEDYKKYKASTPVLIPFIGRKGNSRF